MQMQATTMAHATNATATARPACEATPPARRRRGKADDALSAGARVSSWKVETELGRGGMASVHAVVHTKFGKRAAIKIAHRSVIGDHLSAQTFLREARIVHAVDHPAVIDVFATGSNEGRPYMVMERLAGKTLGQLVDEGPPLPRTTALTYLIELCSVLRAAHDAGIVHRDVKLDNVFVCDVPFADGRRVKLLDWGVAHVAGEDDPFRGLIAGTLTYVAPEQIRGDTLTSAADVYSLAVLAYHLLCRRPPFAAGSDLALIHLHLRARPPKPSVAWADIPVELEDLLLNMLAKTPDGRPSVDVVEQVLRVVRDELDSQAAPATTRFAEGSQPHIDLGTPWSGEGPRDPLPHLDSPWLRWLVARHAPGLARPTGETEAITEAIINATADTGTTSDVLGRPLLPAPPFRLGWMFAAACAAGLAALVSALPG
jgi:serine/threonine protein kinase